MLQCCCKFPHIKAKEDWTAHGDGKFVDAEQNCIIVARVSEVALVTKVCKRKFRASFGLQLLKTRHTPFLRDEAKRKQWLLGGFSSSHQPSIMLMR